MSLHSGSRVRRLRTVDGVPSHSFEDSITGHPSQALLPITQGASASSSVAETPSWGRGTGRRGPSRGATKRRLEPGHKWNVRVISGYGMWYRWDRTPQTDKEMLQYMTAMHKGWRGMLKSKVKTHQCEPDRMEGFRMGRCKDLPNGTQWWVDDESNDHFESMTQMTTHSLQSDDAAPISTEDAFIAVMG
ncbi:hypothetical protein Taro_028871 [Colocasia esculenta]|uniref:Uncharacterized protein n=1 Tax=Colocasia esculenta TaxID=4460 RepID=A0A843VID6_COLES|nr:hypothetical protein [Colocasia esculenta]